MNGYIDLKVPLNVRSSVRLSYEWEGDRLILLEERPVEDGRRWHRSTIVQFRMEQDKWNVYAKDKNNQWIAVPSIMPHSDFEDQLEQVELDREGIFWIS